MHSSREPALHPRIAKLQAKDLSLTHWFGSGFTTFVFEAILIMKNWQIYPDGFRLYYPARPPECPQAFP
jgi:hypothetical protein